jgi:hypothetical protein
MPRVLTLPLQTEDDTVSQLYAVVNEINRIINILDDDDDAAAADEEDAAISHRRTQIVDEIQNAIRHCVFEIADNIDRPNEILIQITTPIATS